MTAAKRLPSFVYINKMSKSIVAHISLRAQPPNKKSILKSQDTMHFNPEPQTLQITKHKSRVYFGHLQSLRLTCKIGGMI